MIGMEIKSGKVPHLLRVAAALSLVALALMMWSMFDPRPAPVLIGLSLGQLLGTSSFAIYLSIVIWDIRRRRREASTPEDRASLSQLR
jgi:hypothetical protein